MVNVDRLNLIITRHKLRKLDKERREDDKQKRWAAVDLAEEMKTDEA